jgi:hypothetical protein
MGDARIDAINEVRANIKTIAGDLWEIWRTGVLASDVGEKPVTAGDLNEAIANVMLAYRHLEDASMRLGKVIQALDGGVSVYDRRTTVGA